MSEEHFNFDVDTFAESIRGSVESIGNQFTEPDDDWIPIMGLVPQEGDNILMAIDGRWLDTDESKDRLVERVMVPSITGIGAKMVALVFSVWMSTPPEGTPIEEALRPSEDPNRVEAVLVNVMDSFKIHSWIAPITRHDDAPPELGEWEEFAESGALSGRFVEEIQQTLRDSSGKTDPRFIEHLESLGIEI